MRSGRRAAARTGAGPRGGARPARRTLPRRGRLPAAVLALALLAGTAGCSDGGERRPALRTDTLPAGRQLAPGVGYQEFTAQGTGGPVRAHLLRVAPDARARLTAEHGRTLAGAQTVRDVARRTHALAAVNASYFDIRGGKGFAGYPGDPIGLYAEQGRVLSESRNDAAALLLGSRDGRTTARITAVASYGRIGAADGATRALDGVDRVAGRLRPCGGPDGERRVEDGRPLTRDVRSGLCEDPDEIVEFTQEWGTTLPEDRSGDAVAAVFAADGTVRGLRSPATGSVPRGMRVLYGIGAGADWLRSHARPGSRVDATTILRDPDGEPVPGPVDSAVGGGARLLKDGELALGERELTRQDRPARTVVGVTRDGTVLLLVLDGREPGVSTGATLAEAGELLRSLGAVDGLNLDGGGSSTMVVDGELRNRPREAKGDPVSERQVATVLAVLPEP
ncbi:phosphodiester glycosidase family protein [Streptomyces sp. NPDC048623]|uniref:phosphodiester glycosidase family protein n=1 Tax=Streptomyces sp. NPDC048623 TaxID=3155761 RepID=UPI003430A646